MSTKPIPLLKFPNLVLELILSELSPIDLFELSLCSEKCASIIKLLKMFDFDFLDINVQTNKSFSLRRKFEKGENGEEEIEFSFGVEPMDWLRNMDYGRREVQGVKMRMRKENENWLLFLPHSNNDNTFHHLKSVFQHVSNLQNNLKFGNISLDFDECPESLFPIFKDIKTCENLYISSFQNAASPDLMSHFLENFNVVDTFSVNLHHNTDRLYQICNHRVSAGSLNIQAPLQYLADFMGTNCEEIRIKEGDFRPRDFKKLVSDWLNSDNNTLTNIVIEHKFYPVAEFGWMDFENGELGQGNNTACGRSMTFLRMDGARAGVVDTSTAFLFETWPNE